MDELRNFNAKKLYQKLAMTDEEFDDWLKELGLLRKTRICDCGGNMSYKQRVGEKYSTWRCTRMTCRKEKGYLTGTWFEGSGSSPISSGFSEEWREGAAAVSWFPSSKGMLPRYFLSFRSTSCQDLQLCQTVGEPIKESKDSLSNIPILRSITASTSWIQTLVPIRR